MTFLDVLGKSMKMIKVPVAGDFLLQNDTMKIIRVAGKLIQII